MCTTAPIWAWITVQARPGGDGPWQVTEQRTQLFDAAGQGLAVRCTLGQARLQPCHAGGQALALDRLDDIVHRLRLEGLQGVLIVGGDEDDQGEGRAIRRPVLGQRLRSFEAAHRRHADVEEAHLGRLREGLGHGRCAVANRGRDLQLGPQGRKLGRQCQRKQGFVFGDQCGGHGEVGKVRGKVRHARVPPSGAASSASDAAGP